MIMFCDFSCSFVSSAAFMHLVCIVVEHFS